MKPINMASLHPINNTTNKIHNHNYKENSFDRILQSLINKTVTAILHIHTFYNICDFNSLGMLIHKNVKCIKKRHTAKKINFHEEICKI